MQLENVKVGVRVVSKVDSFDVRVGDVGTILQAVSIPYVQWIVQMHCTEYKGTPCTALVYSELRKYRG